MLVLMGGYAQAAGVGITSGGGGVFYLQGYSMDGVAGMYISVTYDANSLSSPTVVQGSLISNQGGLLSYNTAATGSITMAAITTSSFSGNGVIATLTFTRNSKVALKTPKVTVTGINSATNPVEISTVTETTDSSGTSGSSGTTSGTEGTSGSGTTDTTTNTSTNTNTTTTPTTWLSGVTMPSDTAPAKEKKDDVKQVEVPVTDALKESAPSDAKDAGDVQEQPAEPKSEKAKEPKFLAYKGVLETLKAYTGPRQPKEILDLFGQQSKGYRQEPAVFLADGKKVLKVRLMPPHDAVSAPNVAINKEAQLVSFRRGDENSWVVELRPKIGAFQVVLTYFLDDIITEIPLTVAPLLATYNGKPFATLTEADFRQFLARGGDPAAQKGNDLNGDGMTDYLDDYLFAANYLVQTAAAKPAAKEQKASPPPAPAAEQKVQPPKKTR
ncbi:MAG: hypothetical protein HZC44_05955 [Geobacter sp.]|nr:hypothetical protein [Geobacter sp.]